MFVARTMHGRCMVMHSRPPRRAPRRGRGPSRFFWPDRGVSQSTGSLAVQRDDLRVIRNGLKVGVRAAEKISFVTHECRRARGVHHGDGAQASEFSRGARAGLRQLVRVEGVSKILSQPMMWRLPATWAKLAGSFCASWRLPGDAIAASGMTRLDEL